MQMLSVGIESFLDTRNPSARWRRGSGLGTERMRGRLKAYSHATAT